MEARRWVVGALGLVLVAGMLGGRPAAAVQADPAPTNVAVAWGEAERLHVRITWADGGTGNIVQEVNKNGRVRTLAFLPAGVGNEFVLLPKQLDWSAVLRIAVFAATDKDTPTSPAGYSPWFDTFRPPEVERQSHVRLQGGTVQVPVRYRSVADPTPGDPFDAPGNAYRVVVSTDRPGCPEATVPAGTNPIVLSCRTRPFTAVARTANEWDQSGISTLALVGDHVVRAGVPAAAPYGYNVITGTLHKTWLGGCTGGRPCPVETAPSQWNVVLQARDSSRHPWANVRIGQSGFDGRFRLSHSLPGTRQYRVVGLSMFDHEDAVFGSASAPVTMVARHRIEDVWARPQTVDYGQLAQACLSSSPPATFTPMLQRRVGTRWFNLTRIGVKNGHGCRWFRSVHRGAVAYRFVLPTISYQGRRVVGTITPAFVLRTR